MSDEKYVNKKLTFVELDLKNVVKRKVRKIEKSKLITNLIQKLGLWETKSVAGISFFMLEDNSFLSFSDKYILASCDLSDVAEFTALMEKIKINPAKPTFFYC